MKTKSKVLVVLMALVMVLGLAACGGNDAEATWADRYAALLDSGEARDNADYDALKAELDDIRIECGATYVYVLTPAGEDGTTPDPAGESGEDGAYLITVDGSEEPDDWGVDYGWEKQFTEAWEGTPAAARSAWDNYGDGHCWSAFAPVYDSEGTVVALLGIDYPCDEVVAANPEWCRDDEAWNGFEDEITGEVPEDVADMRNLVTALANKYAKALSGQEVWADEYAALLESGEARDYAGYDDMKAVLDGIREDIGATYVYVLTPGTDGVPDINGENGEDGAYLITVDGSEEPDDWAVDYGWEKQFSEAWEGTPAAARSSWWNNDDGTEQCWSAFAPVYDSEGNVVALLGIDYPCDEVGAANPEWCRDNEEWNGFEDEITGDVPEDVAAMRALVTNYAKEAARMLSGTIK